jgi:hypothetical protein
VGFRYQLRNSAGDDLGDAEYSYQPQTGDEIRIDGNRRMRVTAFVPVELVAEHVGSPLYGLLEIEPVG